MTRKGLQKIAYELGYGKLFSNNAVLFPDDYRWHLCYAGSFVPAIKGRTLNDVYERLQDRVANCD